MTIWYLKQKEPVSYLQLREWCRFFLKFKCRSALISLYGALLLNQNLTTFRSIIFWGYSRDMETLNPYIPVKEPQLVKMDGH